jgi:hypothetical protein
MKKETAMRIEGQIANGIGQANNAAPRKGADSATAGTVDNSSVGHVPSPELQSLVAAMAQVPAVRADAVAAADHKLASGELSSKATIERTAAVLLG